MGEAPAVVAGETTRDAFFGGRLILHQPAKGHRSGTDAVLLAASAPRDFDGMVYDAGAGVGAVGLAVALASPAARVTLIETDPTSLVLAADNIAANGLADRVGVAACNVFARAARRLQLTESADLVLTNPPFHEASRVRGSPDDRRRAAHVLAEGTRLDDWLLACLDMVDAKGMLIVIHHASAVPELLEVLRPRLGDLTMKPVSPRAGESAARVLLRGRKGSRAPFRLAAPLVLHEGDGFTREAARLHEGLDPIDW